MKIVRFRAEDRSQWGRLRDGIITVANSIDELLSGRDEGEIALENVELLAPCEPTKIVGVAQNYPGVGSPNNQKDPLVFLKSPTSVAGPLDSILLPDGLPRVWGEAELAIVVGQRLCQATPEDSEKSILGFTVANDVTAGDDSGRDHHLARYKSADTFCVLGPWIDTDFRPRTQTVEARSNGVLLRYGQLSDRLLDDGQILSWLSSWTTLNPGDVILTGSPARVGVRTFLSPGDIFTCSISGLGEISSTVATRE